jgi:hypothetical protein
MGYQSSLEDEKQKGIIVIMSFLVSIKFITEDSKVIHTRITTI